jgi:hypothetical protein
VVPGASGSAAQALHTAATTTICARGRIGSLVLLRAARNIQRRSGLSGGTALAGRARMNALCAATVAALVSASSFAQLPREGERPPRPDNASNAAIGGWCDALTGAKKEECLRDERKRQEEKAAAGSSTQGSCDALVAPDKERCLRQGGTVEVETRTEAGARAREAAASQ